MNDTNRVACRGAVVSPRLTVGEPSPEPRRKMGGQGLLSHAQLEALMVNHAEFMRYSMMDYCGNKPQWKFPRLGIPLSIKPFVSLCLSAFLLSLACYLSLSPSHVDPHHHTLSVFRGEY